jgi:serine/threonine protein kinase
MSLTTGQIVGGHYEVTSRLGGGGFGETYLSRDLHLPDRPTRVIKRLSPHIQEASVLQLSRRLFETEAQVLYRLGTHPQIPQLFAHFEELSEFYLVQEYIDGKDLSHELPRGKIWEQFAVADLLQNLLVVLSFVHQNNVIHRDIKPENIIRRLDGQLFLIDFGVVKQIVTPTALLAGQIDDGYTVGIGTPGYMPSEQAHGEP